MMSQASAISNPPPMATPLTAAITGLSRSKREVSPAKPERTNPRLPPEAWNLRSLPAEKARSPAPVTMATHCSGSAAKSSHTFSQLEMSRIVKRVHDVGPVQGHDGEPAFALDLAELWHPVLLVHSGTMHVFCERRKPARGRTRVGPG